MRGEYYCDNQASWLQIGMNLCLFRVWKAAGSEMTTTQSYLFAKDGLQDVSFEVACPAEKLFFALRKPKLCFQLAIHKRNCADQIGNLEESVISRTDILREFPSTAECCVHGFVDEVGHCGLSTVVIHLKPTIWLREGFYGIKEVGCASFELCDDLSFKRGKALVYAYAAIPKFSLSGERHHCEEDAASKFPVHVRIAILAANQRAGMETVVVKAESRQGVIKFSEVVVYSRLLVVNDERYDVESGNVSGKRKMSRFVNKYAQCQIFYHIQKARATAEPSLKAKNFLRISVTPAFRPSSRKIISNLVLGSQRAKQSRYRRFSMLADLYHMANMSRGAFAPDSATKPRTCQD